MVMGYGPYAVVFGLLTVAPVLFTPAGMCRVMVDWTVTATAELKVVPPAAALTASGALPGTALVAVVMVSVAVPVVSPSRVSVGLSKDAVLPGVRGMKGPLSCLTSARFGIAWGVIGAASACFDCAVDYAKHRVQFAGKPIASHQIVQAKLAEMLTQITNMQLLALELSRLKSEHAARPVQVSLVKRHNARAALEIARVCRDILGGNGVTLEYPVMRHMCNLETVFTYEGTHDIHTLIVGQSVTGIPAF